LRDRPRVTEPCAKCGIPAHNVLCRTLRCACVRAPPKRRPLRPTASRGNLCTSRIAGLGVSSRPRVGSSCYWVPRWHCQRPHTRRRLPPATGRWRPGITPTLATRILLISPPRTSARCASPSRFPPASCGVTKQHRSWRKERCSSSRPIPIASNHSFEGPIHGRRIRRRALPHRPTVPDRCTLLASRVFGTRTGRPIRRDRYK
jgi:hypothetical protein